MASITKDIKDSLKEKRMVIGTSAVVKGAKKSLVRSIIHSTDLPPTTRRELEHYSRVGGIELKPFEGNSIQLGQLCGKPFKILVVGIRKG